MTSSQLVIDSPSYVDEALTLPVRFSKVGTPRLNPYQRLLHRLYEPLFFLNVIGQTRGKHTPEARGLSEVEIVCRSFLQALTYLCDFRKGGASCTAIAVEDSQHRYILWVSTNDEVYKERVAAFLRVVLASLHQVDSRRRRQESVHEAEENLLRTCVEFAKQRVTAETKDLKCAVERCQASLKERNLDAVSAWLGSVIVDTMNNTEQCLKAWRAAKSDYIVLLSTEASREERQRGPNDKQGPFAATRHYIGRLAHRLHAYRLLLRHSSEVSYLFSDLEVRVVPSVNAVPAPLQDSHTTLHGILNRMLKTGDPERREIEETLIEMDHATGVFEKFMLNFVRCKPVVHAEVKVLEHFFKEQRRFVQNDRFIACSKPACLCCKLYFQHHPARMVIPQSHEKVWPNWSPPQIASFEKRDEDSRRQLDVLNKIIEALRTDFISQVLKCSQPVAWHADSQTGITAFDDTASIPSDSWASEIELSRASSLSSNPPTHSEIETKTLEMGVKSRADSDRDKPNVFDEDSDNNNDEGVPL